MSTGLMTIDQFCEKHSISHTSFHRIKRRGDIKCVKVGACTRITPQHEAEWLAALPVV